MIQMPRVLESFEQSFKCLVHPDELKHLLFGNAGWPVVQRIVPVMSMAYRRSLPQVGEVQFPKEKFVTYEPSDAVWALPLGIARPTRDIRHGDVLDVNLSGYKSKVVVTSVERVDDCWHVEGDCVVQP
jgi:hypothetical protein